MVSEVLWAAVKIYLIYGICAASISGVLALTATTWFLHSGPVKGLDGKLYVLFIRTVLFVVLFLFLIASLLMLPVLFWHQDYRRKLRETISNCFKKEEMDFDNYVGY